jgi:hypothetical protein
MTANITIPVLPGEILEALQTTHMMLLHQSALGDCSRILQTLLTKKQNWINGLIGGLGATGVLYAAIFALGGPAIPMIGFLFAVKVLTAGIIGATGLGTLGFATVKSILDSGKIEESKAPL